MINIIGERASTENVNPRKNHKLIDRNKLHYYFALTMPKMSDYFYRI
jgi:hypothetical protein